MVTAIANVGHVLLVFAIAQPEAEVKALTRFLVSAEAAGLPFTLAFNKSDLATEEEIEEWRQRLSTWGYSPHFFSVATGAGLSELATLLSTISALWLDRVGLANRA